MKTILALLLAAALWTCGPPPAFAGEPLNNQPNWRTAQFVGNPTTVTVDVIDVATGTQVGNNLATTRLLLDAANSVVFKYDLSTITGYPTGCEAKTYLVVFNPDAADCSATGTPGSCAYDWVQVGGSSCLASMEPISPSIVYASAVQSGQGITQKVLDFYNKRGIRPIRWQVLDVGDDLTFGTPDETIYKVYFYTDTGDAPRVNCTVLTTSDPAVSLPSSAHCSGG